MYETQTKFKKLDQKQNHTGITKHQCIVYHTPVELAGTL